MLRRLIFAGVALLAAGAVPASAQEQMPRLITVLGEGSVSVAPDLAVVYAGVTTTAKTARAASDADSKAMSAVLAALKEAGIADKDIRTSRFSILPLRDTSRNAPPRITGFQASNQVSVKIRATDSTADVLDRLIGAGANDISSIQFVVSSPSKLLDEARGQAIADAHRKAELYATAAGVRLGRAVSITEEGARLPSPILMRAAGAPAAAPPIMAGEETLRVSVTVSYELMH